MSPVQAWEVAHLDSYYNVRHVEKCRKFFLLFYLAGEQQWRLVLAYFRTVHFYGFFFEFFVEHINFRTSEGLFE